MSQTEKNRPSRRIPGSVRRKASREGEWCSLRNSTAVVRDDGLVVKFVQKDGMLVDTMVELKAVDLAD